MRVEYLKVASLMTAKELLRSRLVLLLLLVIPSLFYGIVALTTTTRPIAFELASVAPGTIVEVSERGESLIFIGTAAVGLLSSYLALGLMQKHREASRRLVLCGYRPHELVFARLAVLLGVVLAIGIYIAGIVPAFFAPQRFLFVVLGFVLAGVVYGCYGLLVGALFHRELEGILFIVLLANIDAGWLQNPVYYADAQNQFIIRGLPAYYPSQVSMVGAFTDHAVLRPVLGSLAYGTALLALALAVYFLRIRTARRSR